MTFEQFMARLEAVYGPPKTNDLATFFEIYREVLGRFSQDAYKRGFRLVVARHTHKSWPVPKLCLDALKDAAREIGGNPTTVEHNPFETEWINQHKPHGLLRGPIAETADREGWLLGLNEFLHEKGRLPKPHEVTEIKSTARLVDEWAAGIASSGTPRDGALVQLAKSIVERRKELGEQVFGDRR